MECFNYYSGYCSCLIMPILCHKRHCNIHTYIKEWNINTWSYILMQIIFVIKLNHGDPKILIDFALYIVYLKITYNYLK